MDDPNIVEIHSAANAIEAYAIANALEAAGIKVHVVGDFLEMAAGGLPLGQPIAPSVWVLKEDEARARNLLEEYKNQAENATETTESQESETEEPASEEFAETPEEPPPPLVAGRTLGFLGPLLFIVGIACIGTGIFYTVHNYNLLAYYSKTMQAQFVKYNFVGDKSSNANTPIWYFSYAYNVDGDWHSVATERGKFPGEYITVRYNPQNPADAYADPILYPAWCLILGGIFGGFALFLAYQFRSSNI